MVTRSDPAYVWDFCGGQLAIDFTNTVGSRGDTPEEHFITYADVVSWAQTRRVLPAAHARRLLHEAELRPAAAVDALSSLRALRESLYRTMAAIVSGRKPSATDLAVLNTSMRTSYAGAQLRPHDGRLELAFAREDERMHLDEAIATPVVRAAIDLLTTSAIDRVRLCADSTCGWLFADTTRSGTRRWCDMKVCGNRNKVRRFRSPTAKRR
jgi:predicted RNA-binding Zn ribbon-like protein